MIIKHLGDQVDINCGGIDNIYRHHDYNIAVMEAATGKEYAQIYLHGEHLMVEGQTMSKSRGNILFPEDIYRQGYSPAELRFFLIASKHYREKLNFTSGNMKAAAERLRQTARRVCPRGSTGKRKEAHRPDYLPGNPFPGCFKSRFVSEKRDRPDRKNTGKYIYPFP